ncbi:Zn-ribbon domain-containing OB-fold protein [Acrocarpospora catenulata]|uniref:Zn-ribbon domain-containing OB-fold protein n=1 Tax=Acrocarpospora catenulata TaxID=2836182 RepID=UPI001BDB435A|nr:Zn-ribbon domain-containing OB-fold protein [Acrocarpospora catenulata]
MTESLVHSVNWNIDYKVNLGRAWSRFLVSLRDDRVILGTTCGSCDKTYVPPQAYCEACYEPMDAWVEVPPTGTLEAATIAQHAFQGGPPAPYAIGAIALDGTDTLFIHLISGIDLSDQENARTLLRRGTRVRAVWSQERTGSIRDIDHFAPVG